ncbi:hypothetical protein HPB50_005849 [Hyalomma asiaticum]|uniref:Uncharacterized protein n=1 Tax=Hyalomma asiaticum TaxID=266040 RepID=A0ACB7S3N7_HYAAI|nr:hypothetical protein HPB50_005849 [Hyalomma asiaticum]
MPETAIHYSDKYYDNKYEYRHVILPPEMAQSVPKNHLMTETEWRNLGVQQSLGWEHYMLHLPDNGNSVPPYCRQLLGCNIA